MITTAPIAPIIDDSTADVLVDAAPLIAVPERILMTSADARAVFATRLKEAQHPNPGVLNEIDPALQLGMLVASERSKGRASFYWPYLESLPAQPPCPWMLKTDRDMEACIANAVGGLRCAFTFDYVGCPVCVLCVCCVCGGCVVGVWCVCGVCVVAP